MTPSKNIGLRRLVDDLSGVSVPATLHARILDRINAEPARVETDRKGAIVWINPAFTGLCGYSFAEIRGRKPGSFLQGKESDPEVTNLLRQAVKKGTPCTVEMINYHKAGSPYHVRIAVEPLRDENDELTGFRAAETCLS